MHSFFGMEARNAQDVILIYLAWVGLSSIIGFLLYFISRWIERFKDRCLYEISDLFETRFRLMQWKLEEHLQAANQEPMFITRKRIPTPIYARHVHNATPLRRKEPPKDFQKNRAVLQKL